MDKPILAAHKSSDASPAFIHPHPPDSSSPIGISLPDPEVPTTAPPVRPPAAAAHHPAKAAAQDLAGCAAACRPRRPCASRSASAPVRVAGPGHPPPLRPSSAAYPRPRRVIEEKEETTHALSVIISLMHGISSVCVKLSTPFPETRITFY